MIHSLSLCLIEDGGDAGSSENQVEDYFSVKLADQDAMIKVMSVSSVFKTKLSHYCSSV